MQIKAAAIAVAQCLRKRLLSSFLGGALVTLPTTRRRTSATAARAVNHAVHACTTTIAATGARLQRHTAADSAAQALPQLCTPTAAKARLRVVAQGPVGHVGERASRGHAARHPRELRTWVCGTSRSACVVHG